MNFMIQRTTDEHSLWFEEQVSKTRHEAVLPEQRIDREFQPPCFFSPQVSTVDRCEKHERNTEFFEMAILGPDIVRPSDGRTGSACVQWLLVPVTHGLLEDRPLAISCPMSFRGG